VGKSSGYAIWEKKNSFRVGSDRQILNQTIKENCAPHKIIIIQACLNVAHVTKMPNLRKIRFILKPNLSDSDAALVWKLNDFLRVKHRCEKQ